jgi:hypothetical protein
MTRVAALLVSSPGLFFREQSGHGLSERLPQGDWGLLMML